MQATVPVATIIVLCFCAVFSLVLPFVLAAIWRKRSGEKVKAAIIGALIFVVFVFGLENLCHQFFIFGQNPLSSYIKNHAWSYVLYASLAAGVFEETGRYIAFRFLLKKQNNKSCGIMYGIGHGGIEVIIICTISMISSIALALSINAAGAEALIGSVPAEQAEAVKASITALQTSSPLYFLVSPYERIVALTLHIALSVMVFMAVKRGKIYLYPVAILLHAGVDSFAALYQYGIITNILILEAIITAAVAFIAFWAWRIYRSDDSNASDEESLSEKPSPDESEA